MRQIAARLQQGLGFRTAGRQHDVFPDTDGIAGKPESFLLPAPQGDVWKDDPFGNGLLTIAIERRGKYEQFTAAQADRSRYRDDRTACRSVRAE